MFHLVEFGSSILNHSILVNYGGGRIMSWKQTWSSGIHLTTFNFMLDLPIEYQQPWTMEYVDLCFSLIV